MAFNPPPPSRPASQAWRPHNQPPFFPSYSLVFYVFARLLYCQLKVFSRRSRASSLPSPFQSQIAIVFYQLSHCATYPIPFCVRQPFSTSTPPSLSHSPFPISLSFHFLIHFSLPDFFDQLKTRPISGCPNWATFLLLVANLFKLHGSPLIDMYGGGFCRKVRKTISQDLCGGVGSKVGRKCCSCDGAAGWLAWGLHSE